ncbi:hypothetical protein LB506_008475 [Fusarium annulatum]|nr:hypothetical protein LB506_008475 [Fusarium annulatum]
MWSILSIVYDPSSSHLRMRCHRMDPAVELSACSYPSFATTLVPITKILSCHPDDRAAKMLPKTKYLNPT